MTKLKFTVLVEEVFNEFDCILLGMDYSEDGICKVNYTVGFDTDLHFYVAYRFMNRARLRLKIMDELNLLVPGNPEIDFKSYE